MLKRIIHNILIIGALFSSLAYAETGPLFRIAETGAPAVVDIILCLSGKGPLSCQNYRVSSVILHVTPVAQHFYPAAGIKVLTPGYEATGCVPYYNGYCLFTMGPGAPATIYLSPYSQQKQNQTITFTSTPPSVAPVGSTYTVSATASSGLPVIITVDPSSSSVCSIVGNVVTFNAVGTCTLDANQPGNTQYNPATEVQQNIDVVPTIATSTLVESSLNPSAIGNSVTFTAHVNSPFGPPLSGIVSFTSNGSPISGCTSQSVTSGIATCTTSFATANTFGIVASYTGAGYLPSTSPTFNQFVATTAPASTVPSAPTYVTATPGNAQATVTWLAPTDTGGVPASSITYSVAYWATATGTPASPTAVANCQAISALSCVVTGLANETSYNFQVIASNSIGSAPHLAGYSSPITPKNDIVFAPSILALATSGNSRIIKLTNTTGSPVTGLNLVYPATWGQAGNPTATSTCNTTLAAGSSCIITVTPGSNVTDNCTTGIAPTPDLITVIYNPSSTIQYPVIVLSYGCQYQAGYLFSIDDTTPTTGSIGGTVAATSNQANTVVWYQTPPSYAWATDQSSTMSSPSDDGGNAILNPGQLNCNGNVDGACTSNNVLVLGTATFGTYPAVELCSVPLNSQGVSCATGTTCHNDWYLPAVCQLGYDTAGNGSTCGPSPGIISNMQNNLINVTGTDVAGLLPVAGASYWSSTEYSLSNCAGGLGHCSWFQFFAAAPGTNSFQNYYGKNLPNGARCARTIAY